MPYKSIALVAVALMWLSACTGSPPLVTQVTPPPSLASSTNASDGVGDKGVKETGCDQPASAMREVVRQVGEYSAKVELRRSDNEAAECKGLYWARATPEDLPKDDRAKEVVTRLRVGAGNGVFSTIAEQRAQKSDVIMQPMLTKGRVAEPGQNLIACMEWPYGGRAEGLICTDGYIIP